jgi:hypothetical protein
LADVDGMRDLPFVVDLSFPKATADNHRRPNHRLGPVGTPLTVP